MKPLTELTLMDRFLFACAMEDQEILQSVLQIILGRDIALKDHAETEKEFRTAPWLRSIRLDVITADQDSAVYNTEVQKKNTGNLVKRSRFYQSLIDSSLLPPGEIDFNRMPPAHLITIAPFDLFGHGLYRYSFCMKCREIDDLWMEDGAVRTFLNTRGKNADGVSTELVELLHYFEKTSDQAAAECHSERIKEIHRRISVIKASEEIGVRYMQEWEERIYELREAETRGEERGIKALILDSLEEGVPKERIIAKLQKHFSLKPSEAEAYFDNFAPRA